MSWIPSHQYMSDHPKTRRLARKLVMPVPHVVGHLHLLWHWCMTYAQDGDLTKYDAEEIAFGMMWEDEPEKLIEALVACRFLDSANGRLTVHNWDEYGGKRLRAMQNDASRKRKARQKEAEKTSGQQQPVQDIPAEIPAQPQTSAGRPNNASAVQEMPEQADSSFDQQADAFFSALVTSDGRKGDVRVQRREEENREDKSTGEYSVARARAGDAYSLLADKSNFVTGTNSPPANCEDLRRS